MDKPVRIALIDPYPIFREGVVRTIERSADLVLVAQGETITDAMKALRDAAPDILIIDINAADNCIEELKQLSQSCVGCKVIILTALDDVLSVSTALAMGVKGYILKGVTGLELIGAIKTVYDGQPFVTSELASRLLIEAKGGPLLPLRTSKLPTALSYREQEVLTHISKGLTNREVAAHLGVKVKTIKYYLTQVFKKLKVRNRLEAIQAYQKSNAD
jgi:DNA-binding NarL/FixJ family response regulator